MTRLVLAALAVMLGTGVGAQAHSWYDAKCCSERDCRPVAKGEVTRVPAGWVVRPVGTKIQTFFSDADARIHPSLDVNMHICVGQTTVFCLYRPEPGT